GAVFGQEMLEHAVPVFGGEIAMMERNAQFGADRHGILAVGVGAAGTGAVVLLPVLHEQAVHVVTGLLEKQRGDRGIDAAGNAEHDFHRAVPVAGSRHCSVDSGRRLPASQSSMLASTSGLRRRSPSVAMSSRRIHTARQMPLSSGRSGWCRRVRAAKARRTTCSPASGLHPWCTTRQCSGSTAQPVSLSVSRTAASTNASFGSRWPAGWL